jgi:hypothetical protein
MVCTFIAASFGWMIVSALLGCRSTADRQASVAMCCAASDLARRDDQ